MDATRTLRAADGEQRERPAASHAPDSFQAMIPFISSPMLMAAIITSASAAATARASVLVQNDSGLPLRGVSREIARAEAARQAPPARIRVELAAVMGRTS
jgi:hypothetical protein